MTGNVIERNLLWTEIDRKEPSHAGHETEDGMMGAICPKLQR